MAKQQPDAVLDKGLPCNLDAERMILGSLLIRGDRFGELAADVEPDDFMLEKHRRIFDRMAEIGANGGHINTVTLAEKLMQRNELEAVDGLSYLASLEDGMPVLSNIDPYVAIVREKAALRKLALRFQQGMQRALTGEESPDDIRASILDFLSSDTSGAAMGFSTIGSLIDAAGGLPEYLDRRRAAGLPYSLPTLQRMTGGMRPGEMIVVAAETGSGKTAFALQCALWSGVPAAIFSLEMDATEIADRLITAGGGADVRRERDMSLIRDAVKATMALPDIFISDRDRATVPSIDGALRKLKAKRGVGLAVVDYIQLCSGDVRRGGTRAEEIGTVTRGLKRMAGSQRLPVIALSQFSRAAGRENRKPELRDLKESSSIEQDANIVLMIHFTQRYDLAAGIEHAHGEMIVAKQRNGPTGSFPILFHAPTGRFMEPQ